MIEETAIINLLVKIMNKFDYTSFEIMDYDSDYYEGTSLYVIKIINKIDYKYAVLCYSSNFAYSRFIDDKESYEKQLENERKQFEKEVFGTE